VESGGLLGGSGLIGGSVSVLAGGTFSPGNSPGLLTSGSLSLAGTTLMEIDGLAPRGGVGGYDAADVNGLLTYGGSMLIDFGSGITSALADNMTFNLFSFTSSSSSFSGISTVSDGSFYAGLTFTNSGNNDKWTATKGAQTLEFTHSTGSLVIVPEPGAIALALTGIALGAGLRWRRRRAA
jgi:fibronectin-binding autotransporter adhesin